MKTYEELQDLWESKGVFDKLKDRCLAMVKGEFNWETIHAELDEKNPDYLVNKYEVKEYEEEPQYAIFVSTVFSLYPSGKYYTPWAHSNVTAKEALLDEVYIEALEQILDEQGLWMMSGKGDPCDVFFGKTIGADV